MRLLVFSDLHGNSYALDAFLNKIRGESYDYLIFCGDIFGYYYNQHEIIERLDQLENLIWLKGNHDEYFLQLFYGEKCEDSFVEKYGHSYSDINRKFTKAECEKIEKRKSECVISDRGRKVGIFHGTPQDTLEGRLYPRDAIEEPQIYQQYDIVILGHTHCRMERFSGDTLIANSGSLGQPRDGSGYGYAVVNTSEKVVRFENITLDTTALYRQIDQYDPELKKLKSVLERRKEEFI